MEILYNETYGNLQFIHQNLGRLEYCKDESDAQEVYRAIYDTLDIVGKSISRLDILLSKEPPQRRRNVKHKIDQLKYDVQSVNASLNNLQIRLTNKWRAASEREELLNQRFTANDSVSLNIDDQELQMNDRLLSSHRGIDDLIDQGSAVLEQLKMQGLNLRGVKRKILDIGSTLGLSGTTLRMIEKRLDEDCY
ncbi:Probable Golgi SNAP receptor complex member 2 [Strongyloides ratti]|uniref:Probable Golgi SNAP receptor complex member 2 n=1 Tax=Strongyloides ratti TaxID=34506 RepID=A0A090L6Y0_STRRB|nr:Probable Golgi SNAP receptor complex member 2 [Strongyloides ratti]CEF63224.1 Probable Golgi SNAP receptor complex member 2 [Strongyloides ratti]